MQFADLRLAEPILRALIAENYVTATPIQAQAIPHVLDGKDVLGSAQTGTGKTAAFALPLLHKLAESMTPEQLAGTAGQSGHRPIRALILCPTRELAVQIGLSLKTYGRHVPLKYAVIFGGMNQFPQTQALRSGVDVVIATPGRLMDLMEQGYVDLAKIEIFVLDEADRMLDMGFMPDIRKISGMIPKARQTLLFSATMPRQIEELARTLLRNPVKVEVIATSTAAAKIEQWVYHTDRSQKPSLLAHLVNELPMSRSIVFSRTKHGCDRIVRQLRDHGIRSEAIHGNKNQNARKRALENFRAGKVPVLVATDIASRGIDIDDVSHVVNYDITHEPETYVHRIGRTGRAGATGIAVSLCDREEQGNLRAIERLVKQKLVVKTVEGVIAKPTMNTSGEHDDRRGNNREDRGDDRGAYGRGQGGNSGRRQGGFADRRPARASGPRDQSRGFAPVYNDGPRKEAPRNEAPREERAPRAPATPHKAPRPVHAPHAPHAAHGPRREAPKAAYKAVRREVREVSTPTHADGPVTANLSPKPTVHVEGVRPPRTGPRRGPGFVKGAAGGKSFARKPFAGKPTGGKKFAKAR